MKYRKKPVVIEAIKYINLNSIVEMEDAWGKDFERVNKGVCDFSYELSILTVEGVLVAKVGDFIIKGIKGEFYPCKPDIFEMTYEKEVK